MSLSQSNQRHAPYLPFELVDEIMDEACQTQDQHTISSIALASPRFRILTNNIRFSAPQLSRGRSYDCGYTTKRIKTPAELIKDGNLVSTIPGPASFITSFSVEMLGDTKDILPVFNDGTLAYIFDSIFRPCQLYSSPSNIRSLTLAAGQRIESGNIELIWYQLDFKFLASFQNLLWNSSLNELNLKYVKDIPSNFLQGSGVKYLSLGYRVTIGRYAYSYYAKSFSFAGQIKPTPLETLSIDSISFDDILKVAGPNQLRLPREIFSSLTVLTIRLMTFSDVQNMNGILAHTMCLQSLALRLNFYYTSEQHYTTFPFLSLRRPIVVLEYRAKFQDSDWDIKCTHLRHLKNISFHNEPHSGPAPMMRLLGRGCISSSLEEMSMLFFVAPYDKRCVTIADMLKDKDISIIDTGLAYHSFHSLTRIRIVISVDFSLMAGYFSREQLPSEDFQKDRNLYLKSKVPLLLKRHGSSLETSIRVL